MYFLPPLPHRQEEVTDHHNSAARAPPDTQPHSDLARRHGGFVTFPGKVLESGTPPKTNHVLTKFLLNVNIRGSFGPVHVLISPENTVGDLIKAAIEIYLKEKRRPLLTETDACCFDLHYSQFSMEGLKPEEKLINLGSRNFFMRPKPNSNSKSSNANSSCSDD